MILIIIGLSCIYTGTLDLTTSKSKIFIGETEYAQVFYYIFTSPLIIFIGGIDYFFSYIWILFNSSGVVWELWGYVCLF